MCERTHTTHPVCEAFQQKKFQRQKEINQSFSHRNRHAKHLCKLTNRGEEKKNDRNLPLDGI